MANVKQINAKQNASSSKKQTTDMLVTASKKLETVDEWEFEKIGEFLLKLYHQNVFSARNNWCVSKQQMRNEFAKLFLDLPVELRPKLKTNGKLCVGTALRRAGYLRNTPRNSENFCIKSMTLFKYRNQIVKGFDEKQKSGEFLTKIDDGDSLGPSTSTNNDIELDIDPVLKASIKVDENATSYPLKYQGMKIIDPKVMLTNMGCYICQRNFDSQHKFEDHVYYHNDITDFESLKSFKICDSSIFKLSYQLCTNSHYFCFTLETSHHLIIDKIIIIQARSFYYVHNGRLPSEMNNDGKNKFYVDAHLFTIFLEQPIVIAFHYKENTELCFVEQHNFVRTEEFPLVNFNVNPNYLPGSRTFKPKIELSRYMPSKQMFTALKNDEIIPSLCQISNKFRDYILNGKTLTLDNFIETLNVLLQVEDIDILAEYAALKQRNVALRQPVDEYTFKLRIPEKINVENVISPYDNLLIIQENDEYDETLLEHIMMDSEALGEDKNGKRRRKYTGSIEYINDERVAFTSQRKIPLTEKYIIIFRPARLTFRYQYRALEVLRTSNKNLLQRFLFPQSSSSPSEMSLTLPSSLTLVNKQIGENPEQLQALRNIVSGPSSKAPYIIFGPPGTGKTSTVVEAILQLYKIRPNTRMLVTAGSNGACDEIALRLCKSLADEKDPRAIVRIYSRTYDQRSDDINETLREVSNNYSEHFYPDVETLHEYRIVVCTLSVIGKLATGHFGLDFSGGHVYSHVFIDEAAASTELETLVAIANVLSPDARLILSGDHKQLGPVLQSRRAEELGLDISLMERLLKLDCYRVDSNTDYYDRSIQTRLVRNYRSHPAIVNLYNHMFYDGKLKAEADTDDHQWVSQKWHRSPNPDYPIMFHSVFGNISRDRNSTSMYNMVEVDVVMDYVKDLLYFGINGTKITQSDIGIISPYKKQYQRIQEELKSLNWHQIEIGSVETFQGKEKLIIIVTFVRSFTSTLGFLEDPKRINVTLSRPKSLLILIGNPKTLSINHNFLHIIEQCRRNQTLVGSIIRDDIELTNIIDIPEDNHDSNNIKNNKTAVSRDSHYWHSIPWNNLDELFDDLPRPSINHERTNIPGYNSVHLTENFQKLSMISNRDTGSIGTIGVQQQRTQSSAAAGVAAATRTATTFVHNKPAASSLVPTKSTVVPSAIRSQPSRTTNATTAATSNNLANYPLFRNDPNEIPIYTHSPESPRVYQHYRRVVPPEWQNRGISHNDRQFRRKKSNCAIL